MATSAGGSVAGVAVYWEAPDVDAGDPEDPGELATLYVGSSPTTRSINKPTMVLGQPRELPTRGCGTTTIADCGAGGCTEEDTLMIGRS